MTDHIDVFRLLGNILIHWAALAATVSVLVHLRVRWWQSEMGRHLMAYMAVMAIVLDLSVIRIDVGGDDATWFQVLRFVTFVGVPIVMSHRLWLQLKAQRVRGDDHTEYPLSDGETMREGPHADSGGADVANDPGSGT